MLRKSTRPARIVANVVTDSRYIAADAWRTVRYGLVSAAQRGA